MSSAVESRFRDDADGRTALAGLRLGRGPGYRRPVRAVFAGGARRFLSAPCSPGLEAQGQAYPCYCTAEELELSRKLQRMAGKPPRYAGTCRELTAAQRAEREARRPAGRRCASRCPPDVVIEFTDAVHGPQRFASSDIGDFIIRREDGTSAFFFCNAVDDSAMGVTQVLRGDDHLTNTPRQLMLLDALEMRRPGYGHVGLAGGRGRRAAVEAARQHQRAGISRTRLLERRRAQSLVPPGSHRAMSMAGCRRRTCRRISGREHLGRAPARFEESQLMHWQKETLAADVGGRDPRLAGREDSTEFVELVRHNVVLPADAAPWRAVVRGELAAARAPTSGASSRRRARNSSRPPSTACDAGRLRPEGAHADSEGAHRAQGRRSVHAAARGADRPGARSGARAAAEADAAGNRAAPTRIPCSKSIIR